MARGFWPAGNGGGEIGGDAGRDRTCDLVLRTDLLFQLSYGAGARTMAHRHPTVETRVGR